MLLLLLAVVGFQVGLELPAGFAATEFASDQLAPDIHTIAVSPTGEVFAAGPGYIRMLVEANSTGKAQLAVPILEAPDLRPMGLLVERDSLFVVSGKGAWKYPLDLKRKVTGPPTQLLAVNATGEHDAHAIKRGPDGSLFLLAGNMAGISNKGTAPTSPIASPTAGCLVRLLPTGKIEVVADGFRNAYDFDFGPAGDVFTFDSDNERCIGLPWYLGCQFFHVGVGGHHGWQSPQKSEFWRMPTAFFDRVQPLADLGRGSPTGVIFSKDVAFDDAHQMGFFLLDWTFGRVYFARLEILGGQYRVLSTEVFAKPTGDGGFAPVAGFIHPIRKTLFLATGGRGTRGQIVEIRYKGKRTQLAAAASTLPLGNTELALRKNLESLLFESPDRLLQPANRSLIHKGVHSNARELRVLVSRIIAKQPRTQDLLSAPDRHPTLVQLRAFLAVLHGAAGRPNSTLSAEEVDAFRTLCEPENAIQLTLEDRIDLVRLAQRLSLPNTRSERRTVFEGYPSATGPLRLPSALPDLLANLQTTKRRDELEIELLRLAGFSADIANRFIDPHDRARLRERLMHRSPNLESAITDLIAGVRMTPVDDLPMQSALASKFADLYPRVERDRISVDSNFPRRLEELFTSYQKRFANFETSFCSQPGGVEPANAALYVLVADPRKRRQTAASLLPVIEGREPSSISVDALKLIGDLPRLQTRSLFEKCWNLPPLRATVLQILAREPAAADISRFVAGLQESPSAARTSLVALNALQPNFEDWQNPSRFADLLETLETWSTTNGQSPLEIELLARLRLIANLPTADRPALENWLARRYPAEFAGWQKKRRGVAGVDWVQWQTRLPMIQKLEGNSVRGQAFFVARKCQSCHQGGSAAGPNLAGVTGRFAAADLLRSIVDPGQNIPDRYRVLQIETAAGKTIVGIPIYDSTDATLLIQASGEVIRTSAKEIVSRQISKRSLMPDRLLEGASEQDLADLFAFLRSLGKKSPGG